MVNLQEMRCRLFYVHPVRLLPERHKNDNVINKVDTRQLNVRLPACQQMVQILEEPGLATARPTRWRVMARDGADAADVAECVLRGVELDIRRDGGAPAFPTAVDLLVLVVSVGDAGPRLLSGADVIRRDFVDSPLTRHLADAVEKVGLKAVAEGRTFTRQQAAEALLTQGCSEPLLRWNDWIRCEESHSRHRCGSKRCRVYKGKSSSGECDLRFGETNAQLLSKRIAREGTESGICLPYGGRLDQRGTLRLALWKRPFLARSGVAGMRPES